MSSEIKNKAQELGFPIWDVVNLISDKEKKILIKKMQIAKMIKAGMSNKAIAHTMQASEKTVQSLRKKV